MATLTIDIETIELLSRRRVEPVGSSDVSGSDLTDTEEPSTDGSGDVDCDLSTTSPSQTVPAF